VDWVAGRNQQEPACKKQSGEVLACLEQGADFHMAQLMPLPLTVSCFSKIQIGLTFLVPAHLGSPEKGPLTRVCVRVCFNVFLCFSNVVCRHLQSSRHAVTLTVMG